MLESLRLETLGDLDSGAAAKIVNAAIRRAVEDLDDRGDDGKPRVVTITLTLKVDDTGPVARLQAAVKSPAYATAGTRTELKRENGKSVLGFQTLAPNDPRQSTVDTLDTRDRQEANP